MENIKITIPSKLEHCSQIITGFHQLSLKEREKYKIEFTDLSDDRNGDYYNSAYVFAEYKGKKIVYDVYDGYNSVSTAIPLLEKCDLYFKRSYSDEYNQKYFFNYREKIFPLGFNYHVSFKGNPIDQNKNFTDVLKGLAKRIMRKGVKSYYSSELFESRRRVGHTYGHPKIIFLTRLWDPDRLENGAAISSIGASERNYINEMRIQIIRRLRQRYGVNVICGLFNNSVAQKYAPDLISDWRYTDRKRYLRFMMDADICIGSMGLHESIGWKTGEYIAAGKAIINEKFRYSVPGNFSDGRNYYSFQTVDECLSAVEKLVSEPLLLLEMKMANIEYYNNFLIPNKLIENTLKIASDKVLDGEGLCLNV